MNSSFSNIDLSGEWEFRLGAEPDYNHTVKLPGSLQSQGFGNDVNFETPWVGCLG